MAEEDDEHRASRGGDGDGDLGGCATAVVLAVLVVPFLLVSVMIGAASWWHERDLRDLDALERTTARVVEVDGGYKGTRDRYEIAFTAADEATVRAAVPVDSASSLETEVDVAYVPDEPTRVRTVEDWQPLYEQTALLAVIALAVAPVLVAWQAVSAWRRRRSSGGSKPGAAEPG